MYILKDYVVAHLNKKNTLLIQIELNQDMDTLTLPMNLNTSQYPIIDEDLLEKYKQNRAVSNTAYYILIISYTMLIIMGSIGNLFVITAIKSNKSKFIHIIFLKIHSANLVKKYSLIRIAIGSGQWQ